MIHDLMYNGKNLRSFGFMIKERPIYKYAERDQEFKDICGADEAALIDYGGYKNVDISYKINSNPYWLLGKTDDQIFRDLTDWLSEDNGEYKILRDTYNPGYFTYAIPINPEAFSAEMRCFFNGVINFSRKPFWFSDFGQKLVKYSPNSTSATIEILNPENYSSKPYIKITTSGNITITVNGDTGKTLTIKNIIDYVEIDSEEYNVYVGDDDFNNNVVGDYLPIFQKGINTIEIQSLSSNNITAVEIIPRWRRL